MSPILNEESEMNYLLNNQTRRRDAFDKLSIMQNIEEERTNQFTKSNLYSKDINSINFQSNQESLPLQPRRNTTLSNSSPDEARDNLIVIKDLYDDKTVVDGEMLSIKLNNCKKD